MMSQVLLVIAIHAASFETTDARPAWSWTLEERIERRVDPDARRARRLRDLPSVRQVQDGWSPINGQYEPELFLPSELLLHLMLAVDATSPTVTGQRNQYRTAITSARWEYDDFWRYLESIGVPYLQIRRNAREAQHQHRGQADLTTFRAQICAARTAVLAQARSRFGAEAFDKFLYTAVAPHLRAWYDDQVETALSLDNSERLCK